MTWEAWGAIAELVGAIGVIVSLIYLASQIRHNTAQIDQNARAVRAAALDAGIDRANQIRQSIYQSPDLTRILTAGLADLDQLSEEDRERFRLLMTNAVWTWWNLYAQSQFAELSEATWTAVQHTLRRITSTPGFQSFWAIYRLEIEESFRSEIDGIIADCDA